MAKVTVYVVVERDLVFNDCWYDPSGGERVVKAFRKRERAETLAAKLNDDEGRETQPGGESHVVMEAVVEVQTPNSTSL